MKFRFAIPILLLTVSLGCSGDGKSNAQSDRDTAKGKWYAARATVLSNLARQQYEAGNLADCRKSVDEALKLDPNNVPVRLLSARVSIEQGQLELAEKELQAIRQLDPSTAEADYLSGIIFQRWQQPQAALDSYTRASDKAPAELSYLLARAEMLVTLDRAQHALDLLQQKLNYFENSPAIRDAVGQLHTTMGRYPEAATVFKQATILAPDELPLQERLAFAQFYAKQNRDAASTLEKLLQDEQFAKRADLWTMLGECQMFTERPREARDSFEKATELQPGMTSAWLNLGKAAMQINDPQRAEISFRKALTLNEDSAEAHLMLGYARLRLDRLDEALGSFRTASAIDAKDPVALCMIGYVLDRQGKPTDAMAHFAAALKLNPNDELAATLLARVQPQE